MTLFCERKTQHINFLRDLGTLINCEEIMRSSQCDDEKILDYIMWQTARWLHLVRLSNITRLHPAINGGRVWGFYKTGIAHMVHGNWWYFIPQIGASN